MGDTLTRVIEDIAAGRTGAASAQEAMIKLGVAKLPDIARDNTDRNRTSPFAFTGAKFEFRAVGGSSSIAFPVMILNATVAEAIAELTDALRKERRTTKNADNAVLKVVRKAFRDTHSVRFEGNNYAEAWVREAKKRGLLNLRHTPDALKQMVAPRARALFAKLGVLSSEELNARYNVRVERYIKDLLIELHTLEQIAQTQVLAAALAHLGDLNAAAANAKAARITPIPQASAAGEIGKLVAQLQRALAALRTAIAKAESMHHDPSAAAAFLTRDGAGAMSAVRDACDALEVRIDDSRWPLPRYREILFPV
jgi:glutamine synthetase